MYAASLLWVGLALSPQGEGAAPAVGHEGHAANAPTSRSFRFAQALERARQLVPVRGFREASRKLEGQTVGLGPLVRNPTVELAPNLRFAPSSDLGPEGQLTVRVPLDVVGLGAARERVVAGVGAELGAQAEQLALEESSNAAAAWLSLWATVEARSVAERDLELARELSRKLVSARRAEEATAVDVLDAGGGVKERDR